MLDTGKLDSDLLKKIVFENIHYRRPEVLARPGIGEDCAVIDFGDYECVISTDPITASVSDIGRLAVHISCNDVAANGIQPIGIMLAILLPVGTTEEDIQVIMGQAATAAAELEVEIVGGHTEITSVVNKPVIVSTALGRGDKGASERKEIMKPGDFVMITKSAGLEGIGIIASDKADELRGVLDEEELAHAKSFLDKVSVVKEGVIAGKIGTSGMHDITEGGILGALWEMCQVGKVGAVLWADKVPVEDVTLKICNHFHIDYLRLISSGCMMIVVSPEKKEELTVALGQSGIPVETVGQIRDITEGITMVKDGETNVVSPPSSDEIYKVVG